MDQIQKQANHIFHSLAIDPDLGRFVDTSLPPPSPYRGTDRIRLIVLGQDPTVKDPAARANIKTVLNLDKNGSARRYLSGVCQRLGLKLTEHVYATNLYKNFFMAPPTQIADIDIFQAFTDTWLPLLQVELALFAKVPIITLGQPLLAPLLFDGVPALVRHYWGYREEWKSGAQGELTFISPEHNRLGRSLYPFPHQPSLRKQFYKSKMDDYSAFVKRTAHLE